MQTVHTVISNIPYPTDLHTIPTIHTIPPFMPYIPYLPYIPNIPYFPNMPNQTDHTHHTYPTYHTTPPPHHGGGGGQYHPHHTTGGEGEDLIWGQYMGPIPWGAGGWQGLVHIYTYEIIWGCQIPNRVTRSSSKWNSSDSETFWSQPQPQLSSSPWSEPFRRLAAFSAFWISSAMDLSTISGCFTCMFDGATVFPCTFVPQQNNLMGSWLLLSG